MADLLRKQKLIIESVEQLNEEKVVQLASEVLNEGLGPVDVLELINEGMNRVGKLYESKEYYIADLIMAGIIFKEVLELDKMNEHFHSRKHKKIAKVILGTIKGDIHDIGKDIFRGMLETSSFEVIDLGVDVPKEVFIKKVMDYQPDIVGISGVLTSTLEAMKEVIEGLDETGLRDKVKIIVGGNHLNEDACKYIGADGFANDASVGVKVCREWVNFKDGQGV